MVPYYELIDTRAPIARDTERTLVGVGEERPPRIYSEALRTCAEL
jgi:hypothetical protein